MSNHAASKDRWIPTNTIWSTEELVRKLKRWYEDRSSEPDIEALYHAEQRTGVPPGRHRLCQWELEHDEYYPMYVRARLCEREDAPNEALEIYMHILNRYIPRGTAYYERPAIILERAGEYDDAIRICNMAIRAIQARLFNADTEPFEKRKARLERKRVNRKNQDG
jgi:tetratricopeptide (TPR) repeat protein